MITATHLTKLYGDFAAVDDLSFTIEDGHVYGFLGPNGAGKSTTLNIITGCLAPTSGEVKIDNLDIYENSREAKRKVGYLPEIPPLYVDQTPREYLDFVADAKKVARASKNDEIERVAKETHIEHVLDKPIKFLSKGYRQRVGISQALVGDPQIVILDEPTVGLDPVQILEIRELINELGKKHTVILSSHILSEVQAICDKVLIIYKGKMVAFDAPENLGKNLEQESVIEIFCDCDKESAFEILEDIEEIKDKEILMEEENICKIRVHANGNEPLNVCKKIFMAFASKDIALMQINPIKTTLEDIFIELTKDEEVTTYDSSVTA
ncbi:MAG: ABC transporter ATP-binding protein [Butyrivibrio sp.]|nr:ABC transporter ATP-binding protein [Butyrivibrio sp.]